MRRALMLLALSSSLTMLDATPSTSAELTHGPVVGSVTDSSAVIFVRTDLPATGKVRIVCCSVPFEVAFDTGTPAQTCEASPKDCTALVPVGNLPADTALTVHVYVQGVLQSQTGTFRTFPLPGIEQSFTFVILTDFVLGELRTATPVAPVCGFTSDRHYDDCPELNPTVFSLAAAKGPRFVLIGGDFDHRNPGTSDSDPRCTQVDEDEHTLCQYRTMWKDLYDPEAEGMADFVTLITRGFAIAHVWDDHDYGRDDANKNYEWKRVAKQALCEYLPSYISPCTSPPPPAATTPINQSFRYGRLAEFFMLDSRSQRDRMNDPDAFCVPGPSDKSMLDGDGTSPCTPAGQLQWLINGVVNSPARWKFIFSPVVVNQTIRKLDSWYGYRGELEQLLLATQNVPGVIFLTGDLHGGGLDDGTNTGIPGRVNGRPEMLTPAPNFTNRSPFNCWSNRYEDGGFGTWSHGSYHNPNPKSGKCNGYGVVTVTHSTVTLEVWDDDQNQMTPRLQMNVIQP